MACRPMFQGDGRFLRQSAWESNGGTLIPAMDGYGIAAATAREERDQRRVAELLQQQTHVALVQEHKRKQDHINAMYANYAEIPKLQFKELRCRTDRDGTTRYYYIDEHGRPL